MNFADDVYELCQPISGLYENIDHLSSVGGEAGTEFGNKNINAFH